MKENTRGKILYLGDIWKHYNALKTLLIYNINNSVGNHDHSLYETAYFLNVVESMDYLPKESLDAPSSD